MLALLFQNPLSESRFIAAENLIPFSGGYSRLFAPGFFPFNIGSKEPGKFFTPPHFFQNEKNHGF